MGSIDEFHRLHIRSDSELSSLQPHVDYNGLVRTSLEDQGDQGKMPFKWGGLVRACSCVTVL